eukprot:GFUD01004338.1.p1 GENE.GFUD01004338.1~~GFUD01004338.1.p1  ORF type:complete len:566 (+),score=104.01 GFUD01004338.1:934-2631(+)
MGRISLKNIFFILLGVLGLVYLVYKNRCNVESQKSLFEPITEPYKETSKLDNLTCVLNKEVSKNIGFKLSNKKIFCKTDGREVFIPFSFVKNYYEARGDYVQNGASRDFEISHSYSKVYTPKSKYDPSGQFMHFKSFNVESRSRVKCISASDGVPVSTQWSPAGYYYPTQIAQFSLSHFSNHVANLHKEAQKILIEDGDSIKIALENNAADRVIDQESKSLVIEFKDTLDFHVSSEYLILCLDFKSIDEAAFKIFVETDVKDETIVLNYFPVDEFLSVRNDEIVFGFGSKTDGEWLRITRDVATDIDKVLSMKKSPHRYKKTSLKISLLQFSGHGQVTNISLSNEEHLRMFFHGAKWFLKNQDKNGGWPSEVVFNKDRKKYPKAEEIPAGWYGAMCQGQALSVLVRAFLTSGDQKYLAAAEKAVGVFNVTSSEGGVRAVFMDKHPWYEEYPTNPPTFILNGFMYSLLGLYDLKSISKGKVAKHLYESGLESLMALLPLYDSGSGTFYDLRHFTMKTAPKGARWDYHSTHVNQLLTLFSIERNSKLLKETAERWRGYMIGLRSSHN